MLELADKGIKKVIKIVFCIFKKLFLRHKRYKKEWNRILEIKSTMCEVKNTLEGIKGRLVKVRIQQYELSRIDCREKRKYWKTEPEKKNLGQH